jgi:hypothetical protein
MGFSSHKRSCLMNYVWDKLCGFIHYIVQYVVFIVAYITLKSQFDIKIWHILHLCIIDIFCFVQLQLWFIQNIKHSELQYDLTLHLYVKFDLQERFMSYKLGPIMEIFLPKMVLVWYKYLLVACNFAWCEYFLVEDCVTTRFFKIQFKF